MNGNVKSAPEWRPRNGSFLLEFRLEGLNALGQLRFFARLALPRRPRTDLAVTWT